MIEIKRNCSSSIKYHPEDQQITFGDFTIRITTRHAAMFDWLKIDEQINNPTVLLEEIIQEGLEMMFDKAMIEDLHELENRNTTPVKPCEYRPEDDL